MVAMALEFSGGLPGSATFVAFVLSRWAPERRCHPRRPQLQDADDAVVPTAFMETTLEGYVTPAQGQATRRMHRASFPDRSEFCRRLSGRRLARRWVCRRLA